MTVHLNCASLNWRTLTFDNNGGTKTGTAGGREGGKEGGREEEEMNKAKTKRRIITHHNWQVLLTFNFKIHAK